MLLVSGGTISKYTVAEKKLDELLRGGSQFAVSANGEKLLFKSGPQWRVISTAKAPTPTEGNVAMTLRMELNRPEEWKQIFSEAWKYQRDYFYDRNMHGRDWPEVWKQYEPMISYIKHRADLTYLLDQLGGETSVGHSFVFGGDFPAVDTSRVRRTGYRLNCCRWQVED